MNFTVTFIELIAAAFGLAGTLLLATKGRWAGWGFVAFLASNAAWLMFAVGHGHGGLFVQQLGFTLSSILGIWVWVIAPLMAAPFDHAVNDGEQP